MISYLMEASVCLLILYLFYWLILSREKLLSINRYFLVASLLLSVVLPLLEIPMMSFPTESVNHLQAPADVLESSSFLSEAIPPTFPLFNLYLLGFSISLLRLVFKIISLYRSIKGKKSRKLRGLALISTKKRQVSSFFKYVFMPAHLDHSSTLETILNHEKVHAKDLHSLDLLFVELLKTVFWFHPIIYAFHWSLKVQHEYIADAVAMGSTPEEYQKTLIRHSLDLQGFPISSAFTQPPIEKRIRMIQKHKASLMKKIKPAFALPLVTLLFILISCTDRATPTPSDEITLAELKTAIDELKQILEEQNKGVTNSSSGLPAPSDVTGWLKDAKTNDPIVNAKITSLPSGKSTSPNEEGFYRLPSTPKDTLVTYTAIGYKSLEVSRNDYWKTGKVRLESKR